MVIEAGQGRRSVRWWFCLVAGMGGTRWMLQTNFTQALKHLNKLCGRRMSRGER